MRFILEKMRIPDPGVKRLPSGGGGKNGCGRILRI